MCVFLHDGHDVRDAVGHESGRRDYGGERGVGGAGGAEGYDDDVWGGAGEGGADGGYVEGCAGYGLDGWVGGGWQGGGVADEGGDVVVVLLEAVDYEFSCAAGAADYEDALWGGHFGCGVDV